MSEQEKPKRRWLRRLSWIASITVLVLAGLLVAAKYWIIPSVIRSQAIAALGDYWDGSATLGDIEFNFFGPSYVHDVELRDSDGRPWVRVGSIKVTLRDWPGFHPVLSEIDVQTVRLQPRWQDGKLRLPVKSPPPTDEPSTAGEYVDIRKVSVSDIAIELYDRDELLLAKRDLQFSMTGSRQAYEARLTQDPAPADTELLLAASFDPSSRDGKVSTRILDTITPEQGYNIIALLAGPDGLGLTTRIDIDVSAAGDFSDWLSLKPDGSLSIMGEVVLPGRASPSPIRLAGQFENGDLTMRDTGAGLGDLKLSLGLVRLRNMRELTVEEFSLAGLSGIDWVNVRNIKLDLGALLSKSAEPTNIELAGVASGGQRDKPWVTVASGTFGVRGVVSGNPMLASAEVRTVRGRAKVLGVSGQPVEATQPAPAENAPPAGPSETWTQTYDRISQYVNLDKLSIIDVAPLDQNGAAPAGRGFSFFAQRDGATYKVLFNRPDDPAHPGDSNILGTVNPRDLTVDLDVAVDQKIESALTAVVLRMLNVSKVQSAEGRLALNGHLVGALDKPRTLAFNGSGQLADWTVSGPKGAIATNLGMRLNSRPGRLDMTDFAGRAFGGQMRGAFYALTPDGKPAELGGGLSFDEMRMRNIIDALSNATPWLGLLTGRCDFKINDTGISSLKATGKVFLDDAELGGDDLVAQILSVALNQIGVTREPGKIDVAAAFAMSGTEVLIRKGNLSSAVMAIDIQPGAKINLETRQLDMYIVGVPIEQLRSQLDRIPGLSVLLNLQSNLTRLRIQGSWDAPPIKLVKVEPLGNVGQGTVGFFQDAVKGGGQLGSGVFKSLDDALKGDR